MYTLLLFVSTCVVSTFLIASGAVTTALGISVVVDRMARKPIVASGALLCESAGLVSSMFGFVFRTTDPVQAHQAMIIGALLIALGALIRPTGTRGAKDPLLQRVQLAQYAGMLACMAILALFQSVNAVAA